MPTGSDIADRSYAFALRVVNAYKYLTTVKGEHVMSKRLRRSGTAIGALICEAKFAQSRADFVNKMSIALKEANETIYWVNLLHDSGYSLDNVYGSVFGGINEITAILAAIVKSTKANTHKYGIGKTTT